MAARIPRTQVLFASMLAILLLAPCALVAGPQGLPKAAPEGEISLTLPQVIQMLREGVSSSVLISRIKRTGATFDLTVDELIRLKKVGASNELIVRMAGTMEPAAAPPAPPPEAETGSETATGALSVKQVLRMHRKGTPVEEIVARVAGEGLDEVPDIDTLLAQREKGLPDEIVLALARGGATVAPGATGTPHEPMTADEVIGMLESGEEPSEVATTVATRGMAAPLTLEEALALREAGATDEVISAVNQAASVAPVAPLVAEDVVAVPLSQVEGPPARPTDPARDRVWVTSVPEGCSVYVSPAATQLREATEYDYYIGQTPLEVELDPGAYNVLIEKDADAFDDALLPAWRTVHDLPDTLTVLDNASLTFDPAHCCLPGSVSGRVDTYPVEREQPRSAIGMAFDGLPPYLFDSETLQLMRVEDAQVTETTKVYPLRKNAGESRLVIGLFIPAEGDPLDQASVKGLPTDHPFESYVDAPELSYLTDPAAAPGFAAALGVRQDHLADAVSMLRRAGKAILHQQVPDGVRIVSLMVDDGGRLRLTDRVIKPIDPLAAPPAPPAKGKKKKKARAPEPPPPLPEISRVVVPGLGLPRLVIDNTGDQGVGLVFDDGQFCYVEGKKRREFVVTPGSFDIRMLSPAPAATVPQSRLHFSYHARYTITF